MDVRSRIAMFDKPMSSGQSKPSQSLLRKAPSASQLSASKHHLEPGHAAMHTSIKQAPALPNRPRSNTGAEHKQIKYNEEQEPVPQINVKHIMSIYDQQSANNHQGASASKPPPPPPPQSSKPSTDNASAIHRPHDKDTSNVNLSGEQGSPKPAVRAHPSSTAPQQVAPTIPLRPRHEAISQTNTGSSSSSNSNPAPALPARQAWTVRSTDDLITRGARESSRLSPLPISSISSGGALAAETHNNTPSPPLLPPRHSTTSSFDSDRSFDSPQPDPPSASSSLVPPRRATALSARGNLSPSPSSAVSGNTSQPSSPVPPPRTPTRSHAAARKPISTQGDNVSPHTVSRSNRTTQLALHESSKEPIAPPPRHIDARRNTNASHSPVRPRHRHAYPRRNRKRLGTRSLSARPNSDFAREPSTDARERYEQLYNDLLEVQRKEEGISPMGLKSASVVKLWKRSRLDHEFLGRVWEVAVGANENAAMEGMKCEPFVRAICAIDGELARRRQRATR